MEEELDQIEEVPNKQKIILIAGLVLAGILVVSAVILSFVGTGKKNTKEAPAEIAQENISDSAAQGTNEERPIDIGELAARYGFDLTTEDIQKKIKFAERYVSDWNKDAKLTGFIGVYGNMDLGSGSPKPGKAYLMFYTSKSSPKEGYFVSLDENNDIIKREKIDFNASEIETLDQLGFVLPSDMMIDMAKAFAIAVNSMDRNYVEMPLENKDNLNITLALGYNKKEGHVWQYDFRKGSNLLARISIRADNGKVIVKYP